MSNYASTNANNPFKSYNIEKKIEKKEFEIKTMDFPELSSPIKNNSIKSFSSLLKKEEEEKEIKKEASNEVIIPPGWCVYKYTKYNTNKLFCTNYSKLTSKNNEVVIKQKNDIYEAELIINALSILHEKRTNNYKEMWGEDEWNHNFICPNYDYEYFDKLDEAYELEQNKLNEKYEEYSDYYDYDYDYQ